MAKPSKQRTPNDQRAIVKNPTSEEYQKDIANTEKQKAAQPKKKK